MKTILDGCGTDLLFARDLRHFFAQALLRSLILGEEPERPGHRDGRGLVTGDKEGVEIALELGVGHHALRLRVSRRQEKLQKNPRARRPMRAALR